MKLREKAEKLEVKEFELGSTVWDFRVLTTTLLSPDLRGSTFCVQIQGFFGKFQERPEIKH